MAASFSKYEPKPYLDKTGYDLYGRTRVTGIK